MDKERDPKATVIGLTRPERWSADATDMFILLASKPGIEEMLGHDFMKKKNQESLTSFVPYVLIAAAH
jgi:hypothetical protein